MLLRQAAFRGLGTLHRPASGPSCSLRAVQPRTPFHSTCALRDDIDDKNHYETLKLQPNATSADIKKSFYSLSKVHHPDHNPKDPHASRRFMRINEAYSVLSHTERRAKYDRDVLRLDHRQHHHHGHPHHQGSYYHGSTGPAGGRPASGLSRRRGTFRGPPPSFYRSGGWGAHGAKRQAAHEASTGTGTGNGTGNGTGGGASSSSNNNTTSTGFGQNHQQQSRPSGRSGSEEQRGNNNPSDGGPGRRAGMGPGQDPFRHWDWGQEVPHFDRAGHFRTQQRSDERRARRMARERGMPNPGDFTDMGAFFVILGVLTFAAVGPWLIIRSLQGVGDERPNKSNGSKWTRPAGT